MAHAAPAAPMRSPKMNTGSSPMFKTPLAINGTVARTASPCARAVAAKMDAKTIVNAPPRITAM